MSYYDKFEMCSWVRQAFFMMILVEKVLRLYDPRSVSWHIFFGNKFDERTVPFLIIWKEENFFEIQLSFDRSQLILELRLNQKC